MPLAGLHSFRLKQEIIKSSSGRPGTTKNASLVGLEAGQKTKGLCPPGELRPKKWTDWPGAAAEEGFARLPKTGLPVTHAGAPRTQVYASLHLGWEHSTWLDGCAPARAYAGGGLAMCLGHTNATDASTATLRVFNKNMSLPIWQLDRMQGTPSASMMLLVTSLTHAGTRRQISGSNVPSLACCHVTDYAMNSFQAGCGISSVFAA
eukprot:scaffold29287_cov19-Tisochrysis_lutea.AAC.1